MKLKEGWTLTELAGEYVAVPTGESAKTFSGIVRLNETGRDIWQGLADGLDEDGIAYRLTELYDGIDHDTAKSAVQKVFAKLMKEGLLEE